VKTKLLLHKKKRKVQNKFLILVIAEMESRRACKNDMFQRNRNIRDKVLEVSNCMNSLNESFVKGEELVSSADS
jgi:hypothetical protein